MVCPKGEFDEWHKCKCLFGDYFRCAVHILPLCPKEIIGSNFDMVQWRHYDLETTMARYDSPLKKLTFVYKTISFAEFVDYMKPKLQHFIKHNFIARWQDKHFKHYIKSFPTNIVVSIVDFVKNYGFEVQNEIQSMHWHMYQISILIHICFHWNLTLDPYDEDSWILTKYHFYIFDDKRHDSEFV